MLVASTHAQPRWPRPLMVVLQVAGSQHLQTASNQFSPSPLPLLACQSPFLACCERQTLSTAVGGSGQAWFPKIVLIVLFSTSTAGAGKREKEKMEGASSHPQSWNYRVAMTETRNSN